VPTAGYAQLMTATASLATTGPEVSSSPAASALRDGLAHFNAGRLDQAIATFQRGIADLEREAAGQTSVAVAAELHFKLGNAAMTKGDLDLAAKQYSDALRLAPEMTACWCNLGNVYLNWDRAQDAISLYMHALSLDPGHWAARTNLVYALIATRQHVLARVLMVELIEERPQDGRLRNQLGKFYADAGELDAALECFEYALSINPDDADSLYCLGNIRQKMDDIGAAEAAYVRAAKLQPLIRRPAARQPAAFRVLALFAPFAGNTPTEYLLTGPSYETNTLAVFEGRDYDIAMLRNSADVVFNLISDADQAESVQPLVTDLVDRIGLPTVNLPRKILGTTREIIAQRLQGIPGCLVAKVLRLPADVSSITALEAASAFAMPVLVRPAGTHGGDDFEKFTNLSEAASFIGQHPGAEHYLIEYLDYRSADGNYRKYRFIFAGDEILPYHLAIGRHWKLHHDSTDMIDHEWMQREEQEFLGDPTVFFTPDNYAALRAIRAAIDLEYFGIDCGLDPAGNLVVFEVNASMLIHQHNENFPYKTPYVERIRAAFEVVLAKMAGVA
jgi:tetratricopeptide (TPR) repeat protein